jgi:glycosyltransferase involved in cell wall biosynthesis
MDAGSVGYSEERGARALPLVSCIMPTRDRADLAAQAARYFLAQDYPNRELIIVEQGSSALRDTLPRSNAIQHVSIEGHHRSIGALRNLGCQLARGDIFAHWDDDDWYGPERISRQVDAINRDAADITALRDAAILDLASWKFWRCSPVLHRRMFKLDVHGGTLVYHRHVWDRLAQYPDTSLAEDAAFLDQAVRQGARLRSVGADGIFVYLRHESNAWTFRCGHFVDPTGWRRVADPLLPEADRSFYASRAPVVGCTRAGFREPPIPLVSCIMPTRDRRKFVLRAIEYFFRQDYPAKELVIVDDGADPVADLIPTDASITYRRLDRPMTLGAKRNFSCTLARGSVIVHWDDDDWNAPHRLHTQVMNLLSTGADVCGARALYFYDPSIRQAWRYSYPQGLRPLVAGTSLCYTREAWVKTPFPAVAIGEDTRFVLAQRAGMVVDVSDANCVVGILHRGNTAPKDVHGGCWTPVPVHEPERLMSRDLTFYAAFAVAVS